LDKSLTDSLKGWLPYAIGALLVVQFAGLGVWQVSRAFEKQAHRREFDEQSGFRPFAGGMDVRPYQRLAAEGRFDADHQVLLDNIILESRYGYYVLTPLVHNSEEPVLIVNRGWIERGADPDDPEALAVPDTRVTVRGRVGSLPRAGYRMAEAFSDAGAWPRHAVYPTLEEVAAQLGRPVQPFVLLMDPGDEYGLVRHWTPEEMGPARHYAYALQWFAMGAALAGLLVWNFRKRGLEQ
jgi:surfeit locus 1 family protein